MKRYRVIAALIASFFTFAFLLTIGFFHDGSARTATIQQISPTREQEEMMDMLARAGKDFLIFDYHLCNEFHRQRPDANVFYQLEVWVEIYHYGELIARHSGIDIFGGREGFRGQFMILRDQGTNFATPQDFQWTFFTEFASFQDQNWSMESDDPLSWGWSGISGSQPIIDGEKIVLHAALFSADDLRIFADLQAYLEPENRDELTYLHLIIARFSSFLEMKYRYSPATGGG